jgi:hypothetical protein
VLLRESLDHMEREELLDSQDCQDHADLLGQELRVRKESRLSIVVHSATDVKWESSILEAMGLL